MTNNEKIMNEYKQACEEISRQCVEEGYPSHGANYEARCERLWDEYYALELEED